MPRFVVRAVLLAHLHDQLGNGREARVVDHRFARGVQQPIFPVQEVDEQEGLRAAADDLDEAASLGRAELGAPRRLPDQRERRFELGRVLLEALAVDRVTLDQVVAQASGGQIRNCVPFFELTR